MAFLLLLALVGCGSSSGKDSAPSQSSNSASRPPDKPVNSSPSISDPANDSRDVELLRVDVPSQVNDETIIEELVMEASVERADTAQVVGTLNGEAMDIGFDRITVADAGGGTFLHTLVSSSGNVVATYSSNVNELTVIVSNNNTSESRLLAPVAAFIVKVAVSAMVGAISNSIYYTIRHPKNWDFKECAASALDGAIQGAALGPFVEARLATALRPVTERVVLRIGRSVNFRQAFGAARHLLQQFVEAIKNTLF